MKCNVCGSDLIAGTKKCPYCGSLIKIARTKADEVFDWSMASVQPKRKKDVSVDWNSGRLFDNVSGQIYNSQSNSWSEPDDVKDLFKFDQKNEKYQEVLDRQVDSIAVIDPENTYKSDTSQETFRLPASMNMISFDDLIDDEDDGAAYAAQDEAGEIEGDRADRADMKDELPAAASAAYTPEEEDRVFSGLKRLMAAEEKFKSDMEKASYLTPEETAQAAKAEEKSRRLTFVPTITFRSLEDEYAEYCDENGIKHEKPAQDTAAADISSAEHSTGRKHSLKDSISGALKNIDKTKDRDKAVEIKINEPSGTKVTVKTQEISLAAAENGGEGARTREVNMEDVVKPPKNLQVSVEVNAAQGNASVEVTRRHDGATVVKTVDKSNQEHVYSDEEAAAADVIQDEQTAGLETPDDSESFWERSDKAPRMTITDIFGPEARKILNQIDKAYGEENQPDDDIENSLILDINPADIAMTEEQTAALYSVASEAADDSDESEAQAEAEGAEDTESAEEDDIRKDDNQAEDTSEEADAAAENLNDEAEESKENTAASEAEISDEKPAEDGKSEEDKSEAGDVVNAAGSEVSEEKHDGQENEKASDSEADEDRTEVSDSNVSSDKAHVETEEPESDIENDKQKSENAAKITDTPELEKTKPILKAEKAILKEAERQKKRAEKAQKKLLKENEVKEKKASSRILKLFITILAVILIVEFAVIGIKLFAADSQAAVFIDRVEQYASELISGGSSGSGGADSQDTAPSDQTEQQSQNDSSQTEDITEGDGANAAPDGEAQ